VQSVEIGFRLLELLADAPGPMSLTAIAQQAGMGKVRAATGRAILARMPADTVRGVIERATTRTPALHARTSGKAERFVRTMLDEWAYLVG
jgi:DNA-binding IclR family transcriptional regulator